MPSEIIYSLLCVLPWVIGLQAGATNFVHSLLFCKTGGQSGKEHSCSFNGPDIWTSDGICKFAARKSKKTLILIFDVSGKPAWGSKAVILKHYALELWVPISQVSEVQV